jgi:hypothetical protein
MWRLTVDLCLIRSSVLSVFQAKLMGRLDDVRGELGLDLESSEDEYERKEEDGDKEDEGDKAGDKEEAKVRRRR